jgi:choline kinase
MIRSIVLAAGRGTRLRPLTNAKPKCMVDLCGRPILTQHISGLRKAGCTQIEIISGYRSDKIRAPFANLIINKEFASTNMVFSLFYGLNNINPESDVLISYGDSVYEPRVIRALLDCKSPVAITIDLSWLEVWKKRFDNPLDDAETLRLNPDGSLREIGRRASNLRHIEGQFMGLVKIRKNALGPVREVWENLETISTEDSRQRNKIDMTTFIQVLIELGLPIATVPLSHGWLEVDSKSDLQLYETLYQQKRLQNICDLDLINS